jgi:hypothetical protein
MIVFRLAFVVAFYPVYGSSLTPRMYFRDFFPEERKNMNLPGKEIVI